ncbi:gamma-glutamyltransferase [Nocardioides sp. T2.26MG-1]|uniref:gamma-glutamyltransferase n=1 Tax=Nocardioides sp. T2.26MG-1 TaxID=3041166 RepID=UPI002477B781|nr:gamma-glutamyltransferase [Nocardioides sp. T2.26MG-1]CAI9416151.1 Glutathione hydrolase proenzyme [Nocardioides sp. T2.26MG-1]
MPDVAIAAPNDAAADAGEQVALAGGNAVDAALAASLVTMVNEVGLVSLSSGGFVTVQPPGGPAYTADGWMDMPGRGRALGGGTWDIHTEYGGGVDITIGPGSVAAHGSVAAFEEVHRRDGRLPWRDVVAPALDVARGGFRLSAASRYYLDYVHDSIFGWDDASRAAVHDDQGEVTTGLVVLPDLARSLELIAVEGAAVLHTGELARLIAADVLDRGGILGPDDLAAYRPVVHTSLATRVGEWTLATTPPPSVGGASVAAMLRLLGGRPHGPWTAEDVELLVRVQREVLGRGPALLRESGSTTHCSATDTEGRACAVTVSSGYFSGMIARGTGIWLNNTLGEQELTPGGLHSLSPGTRLLSNMAPTVGRHTDGSVLAIGSPGAGRIATAVAQVLAGFAGGLGLAEAVHHPRVHVHHAGRADEVVKREAEEGLSMYYGGVGATLVRPDGHLVAAADPRREGAVRLVRT